VTHALIQIPHRRLQLLSRKGQSLYPYLIMKPELKFHSYVTALIVVIMYFFIQTLLPLVKLNVLNDNYEFFVKLLSTLLLSIGLYTLLATISLSATRKFKCVKRYFLGGSYLHGTWIGKFQIEDKSFVYTVEHFEQTLSSLKIIGIARHTSGDFYARWHSVCETIDEISGLLTYTYNCDKTDDKFSIQGICNFQFDREDETSGATGLEGYSADIVNGIRTMNSEKKLSEDLIQFDKAFAEVFKSITESEKK
jgi:hypothetical protein